MKNKLLFMAVLFFGFLIKIEAQTTDVLILNDRVTAMTVKGDFLYYSTFYSPIKRINLTEENPVPTDVVSFNDGSAMITALVFHGDDLFIGRQSGSNSNGKVSKITINDEVAVPINVLNNLNAPHGLAFDNNSLYIADAMSRILKIEDVSAENLVVTDILTGITGIQSLVFKDSSLYFGKRAYHVGADQYLAKIDFTADNIASEVIGSGDQGWYGSNLIMVNEHLLFNQVNQISNVDIKSSTIQNVLFALDQFSYSQIAAIAGNGDELYMAMDGMMLGSGKIVKYVMDIAKPTVTISDAPQVTNTSFTATFEFSEIVTGFEEADINVDNGSVSDFTTVNDSVYTALITPTSNGNVIIEVNAGVAHDGTLNANEAAEQINVTYDTVAPTVNLTYSGASPTNLSAIPVTITFSESVADFDSTDLTISNGSATNFVGSGASYSFDLTPATDGTVSVDIASDIAIDGADNGNEAASQFSIEFDATAPTLEITSTVSGTSGVSPIPVMVTFSESVVDFDSSDLTISNGSASNFAGSGASYSFDLTPTSDGGVTIDIEADVASDGAENGNEAAEQFLIEYDTTLGTEEHEMVEMNVYPNPTTKFINISVQDQIEKVTVFDITGKAIFETEDKSFSVEGFADGVYLLTVETVKGKVVRKFIKE